MVCRKEEYIPEYEDIKHTMESGVHKPEMIADESVRVREDDFKQFMDVLRDICDKELNEGNEIAVDMTLERKFMSALSMGLGSLEGTM